MTLDNDALRVALGECQRVLAMMIDPKGKGSGTAIITAYAQCVEAEATARKALALPAPASVAGDGLVERLQRPWDGSSGSRDRRDAERREAATLITELQAKVARMEVEAFDAAIAHGKTKLALAKSEASREAAEAMVAEARKVINELIRTCRPEPIIFDTGEAALRAARTWMEGGR